jgi:hypothetical protein
MGNSEIVQNTQCGVRSAEFEKAGFVDFQSILHIAKSALTLVLCRPLRGAGRGEFWDWFYI